MASTTITRISWEEFEQMPERAGKEELFDGELIELPPPKLRHNLIADRLVDLIKAILKGQPITGLGRAFHEMGYRFGKNTWLVPDVSVTQAGQAGGDYLLNSPALAIEIISESNTAKRVETKLGVYLENGALEVWILYPSQRHMRVFRPNGTTEIVSNRFKSELLGGATIDLNEILAD